MDVRNKLNEVIPPNDFRHRNDFSNYHLIDALSPNEKAELENALIEKSIETSDDTLIIKTLAYLRSKKALPVIELSLRESDSDLDKVIISFYIFAISHDDRMVKVAMNSFNSITEELDLALLFRYLASFNDKQIDNRISSYIDHPNLLVSYNAKIALGLIRD